MSNPNYVKKKKKVNLQLIEFIFSHGILNDLTLSATTMLL